MTLLASLRARDYAESIGQRAQAYVAPFNEEERMSAQLDLWNIEWQRLLASVPYYQRLRGELNLPDRFDCWQGFVDRVPVTTRATVQKKGNEMTSSEKAPDCWRATGGSTAQPIQIPAWNQEEAFTRYDMWLGRSWYGVSPDSRLFLLWGHSHLLGTGIKGWIKGRKRKVFDWLMGYYRFSAYELRPQALRRAARELLNFKPDYVIGYSVALDLFARANADLRDELHSVGVKVVVGTAESFPASESAALLEDLFGCPVAMEYGAMETGLVAHTHPRGGYRVFWKSYFVEAERDDAAPEGLTVRVTSLYPRCLPLVRYELGDQIQTSDPKAERAIGIATFERVLGRCNAYAVLQDGAMVHSEAFSHAVRACSEITSYQVIQRGPDVQLHYTSRQCLTEQALAPVRVRLAKVHPLLAAVEMRKVDVLQQTIAGKTPMVIRE